MSFKDWLQKKSEAKSASNILDDLRPLVAAVRTDVNEAMHDAETDAVGQPGFLERWRSRTGKVREAQKKLLEDVAVWSSLPPERSFNEVILPALQSGELVGPSEVCFGPVIVAAFRACEAGALQRGVKLEAHVSADILETVKEAGDLYR